MQSEKLLRDEEAEARSLQSEAQVKSLQSTLLSEAKEHALVVAELKEAEMARDQAFHSLTELQAQTSFQLTEHERHCTTALRHDLEEARSELKNAVSQREATADETSAELSAALSKLSTSESFAKQLTVQLEQMQSEKLLGDEEAEARSLQSEAQ